MWISQAFASAGTAGAAAGGAGEAVVLNLLFIVLLVVMFYVLLIRPQQKRFKQHREMLEGLKKGEKVVTAGGILATIEKIEQDSDEVVLNLGDTKVTALKSTIQTRNEPVKESVLPAKKEDKKSADKNEDKKTEKPKKKKTTSDKLSDKNEEAAS